MYRQGDIFMHTTKRFAHVTVTDCASDLSNYNSGSLSAYGVNCEGILKDFLKKGYPYIRVVSVVFRRREIRRHAVTKIFLFLFHSCLLLQLPPILKLPKFIYVATSAL